MRTALLLRTQCVSVEETQATLVVATTPKPPNPTPPDSNNSRPTPPTAAVPHSRKRRFAGHSATSRGSREAPSAHRRGTRKGLREIKEVFRAELTKAVKPEERSRWPTYSCTGGGYQGRCGPAHFNVFFSWQKKARELRHNGRRCRSRWDAQSNLSSAYALAWSSWQIVSAASNRTARSVEARQLLATHALGVAERAIAGR